MFSLDPRTIVFISMFIYVLLAVVMTAFSASLKHQRGPGYWAVGTCCWALFGLLLPWRGVLPSWLTFVVANTGLIVALCLLSHGLAVLLAQRPRYLLHGLICLASLAGYVQFSLLKNDFLARVVVATLAFDALAVEMGTRLLPLGPKPRDPARLLVLAVLVGAFLFYSLRMALTLLDAVHDLFQDRTLNIVTLMLFPLSVVALNFSLLALAASQFARQKEQANANLAEANARLRQALDSVKTLSGLLPICSHCHKIRDDQGHWRRIEAYIRDRTDPDFSHGICPACAQEHYGEYLEDEPQPG